MKKAIVSALFIFGFALATNAQTATPKVNARQAEQKARIRQGVQSGELTKKEAAAARANQAAIQNAENKAKSDGVVTNGERKKLDNMQDNASRRIRRNKNDRQDRN
jgi:hypothetical protein